MPRKTDSNNPADWLLMCESDMEVLRMAAKQELGYSLCRSKLADAYFRDRYPGFDLEDPDWPKLREQLRRIEDILLIVESRLPLKGV